MIWFLTLGALALGAWWWSQRESLADELPAPEEPEGVAEPLPPPPPPPPPLPSGPIESTQVVGEAIPFPDPSTPGADGGFAPTPGGGLPPPSPGTVQNFAGVVPPPPPPKGPGEITGQVDCGDPITFWHHEQTERLHFSAPQQMLLALGAPDRGPCVYIVDAYLCVTPASGVSYGALSSILAGSLTPQQQGDMLQAYAETIPLVDAKGLPALAQFDRGAFKRHYRAWVLTDPAGVPYIQAVKTFRMPGAKDPCPDWAPLWPRPRGQAAFSVANDLGQLQSWRAAPKVTFSREGKTLVLALELSGLPRFLFSEGELRASSDWPQALDIRLEGRISPQ